jgi:hypothetical protein
MEQRILAAYTLGRDSHQWQLLRELDIDETSTGLGLWQNIQDGLIRLADRIYPRVLVELRRDGLEAQKEFDGPSTSAPLERPDGICFAWFHSLIGRALETSWQLAPWFQLGSTIGAFLVGVLREPLAMPSGGLVAIRDAADALVKKQNCTMPELVALASNATEFAGPGSIAFLEGALGGTYQPHACDNDAQMEAMILFGRLHELDTRVEKWLPQNKDLGRPKTRGRESRFSWHSLDEKRPKTFAYGPVSDTKERLAKWILSRSSDPRQLKHFADTAVWFAKEHRKLYQAFFSNPDMYERAKKRQEEEKPDSNAVEGK